MLKKTNNQRRGSAAHAKRRRVSHAKRRARIQEKSQGASNYVLEPHPELYLGRKTTITGRSPAEAGTAARSWKPRYQGTGKGERK